MYNFAVVQEKITVETSENGDIVPSYNHDRSLVPLYLFSKVNIDYVDYIVIIIMTRISEIFLR